MRDSRGLFHLDDATAAGISRQIWAGSWLRRRSRGWPARAVGADQFAGQGPGGGDSPINAGSEGENITVVRTNNDALVVRVLDVQSDEMAIVKSQHGSPVPNRVRQNGRVVDAPVCIPRRECGEHV